MTAQRMFDALMNLRSALIEKGFIKPSGTTQRMFDGVLVKLQRAALKETREA